MIVSGNVDYLDQVLSNLIANALRHAPQGGQLSLQAERSLTLSGQLSRVRVKIIVVEFSV